MSLRSLRVPVVRVAALAAVLAATVGPGGSADAAPYRYGRFVFDKNPDAPADSRLFWRVYEEDYPNPVAQRVWRAGSGDGASRDECATGHGWLPNGWYTVTLIPDKDDKIKGIAFQLDHKACAGGRVTRTELFIHSEMKANGDQGCPDEPRCWDGDRDYRSEGCIKLQPDDIKAARDEFTRLYAARTTYGNMLQVVD
jgi:hypothetical protein